MFETQKDVEEHTDRQINNIDEKWKNKTLNFLLTAVRGKLYCFC